MKQIELDRGRCDCCGNFNEARQKEFYRLLELWAAQQVALGATDEGFWQDHLQRVLHFPKGTILPQLTLSGEFSCPAPCTARGRFTRTAHLRKEFQQDHHPYEDAVYDFTRGQSDFEITPPCHDWEPEVIKATCLETTQTFPPHSKPYQRAKQRLLDEFGLDLD
ncbi:hypothetical protein HYU91_03610 [Candidatus Collierbacteria bacterium]|nr:hypothetical protein [Candidatus Collierbacteria bacterium]